MGKFAVFVLAAIGGFFAVSGVGGSGGGFSEGEMSDMQMEGCMRQMRQITATESLASSACSCVYEELDARGLTLMDALGSDFAEMSRVTRSCAAKYGAELPPL